MPHTCTIVVGIQHGKESANDKEVCIIGENHLDGFFDNVNNSRLWLLPVSSTEVMRACSELQASCTL